MNEKLYNIHQYLNKHSFKPVYKIFYKGDVSGNNYKLYKCDCGYYDYSLIENNETEEFRGLSHEKAPEFLNSILCSVTKKEQEEILEVLFLKGMSKERLYHILAQYSGQTWNKIAGS